MSRQLATQYEAPRVGDIRDSWADIARARELLGFEPAVSLKRGIELTISAFDGSG